MRVPPRSKRTDTLVPCTRLFGSNIGACDIVIVPSVWLSPSGWDSGRYPRVVAWLKQVHARGAVLRSACSGIFLLAESGLFDQRNANVHFGYARQFAALYPDRSEARRVGKGCGSPVRSRWSPDNL